MSVKNFLRITFFVFLFFPFFSFASESELAVQCKELSESDKVCQNMSSAECRKILERCAAYYDNQSAEIAKDLSKTTAQKNTLQNQIANLKKRITALEYQINQGNLMIKSLNAQIDDTQISIDKTEAKIKESQTQIANVLRTIYEEDKKSSLQILFEGNLADFFSNIAYLESLNYRISELLKSSQNLAAYLQEQKDKQENEKFQLQKTIQIQSLQKKENEANKKQQDAYLKLTEAQYQQQLKEKEAADKNAAAIKARLFDLVGVSKVPTFGEALEIAKWVFNITGIRPALLLGILTQESSLGRNVGQCYLTDFTNGSGTSLQGAFRQRVMNPKSIPSFIALTQLLGMEATKTPVSCWIPLYSGGIPYGWGGAMGPAQFIASTWDLYKNKVSQIMGTTANPWNIKHAFLAAGLLLKDNGAITNESVAAAKYYCGNSYWRSECRSYANSVLKYASQYEADIKAIGQ